MPCPEKSSAAWVRLLFITSFNSGHGPDSFEICGGRAWRNTTTWQASRGIGKRPTARTSKRPWRENRLAPIRRIGEKNGSKRSVLVDGRGVPLSIVVSGANRHDSVVLEPLLKERMTLGQAEEAAERNLCLDAGYVGKEALVRSQGFVPHIRPRGEEKRLLEKDPGFKARRWVVEAAHS